MTSDTSGFRIMGAVLAGGESRRMGRDKALLEWQGRPLLARAVEEVGSVIDEVCIVAPDDRNYAELGYEIVPDVRPGSGPLGGIHAALMRARGRPIFVLACDMPLVGRDMVRWIVDAFQRDIAVDVSGPRAQAWVIRDGAGLQPLCGIYTGDCLAVVEAALDDDRRSARALLDALVSKSLALDPESSWFRPDLLTSVNDRESFADLAGIPRPSP